MLRFVGFSVLFVFFFFFCCFACISFYVSFSFVIKFSFACFASFHVETTDVHVLHLACPRVQFMWAFGPLLYGLVAAGLMSQSLF